MPEGTTTSSSSTSRWAMSAKTADGLQVLRSSSATSPSGPASTSGPALREAADALHVSQPAFSRRIEKLERINADVRGAELPARATAEQFALYQQDAQPTVMGVLSDVLARRPATDDDDVDAAHAVRAVRLGRAVRIGGRVRTVDAGHAVRTLGLGGYASVLRRGLGCAVDEVDVFAVTPDPALDERAQRQHLAGALVTHVVERETGDLRAGDRHENQRADTEDQDDETKRAFTKRKTRRKFGNLGRP